HFALEQLVGRVGPEAERVPPAELDRAELRMLERVPVDEAAPAELGVAVAQQCEVVVDRVLVEPFDQVVLLDARAWNRAPELRGPRVDTEMVVRPRVGAASDHVLRVVAEVVVHADMSIPGELRAARAKL